MGSIDIFKNFHEKKFEQKIFLFQQYLYFFKYFNEELESIVEDGRIRPNFFMPRIVDESFMRFTINVRSFIKNIINNLDSIINQESFGTEIPEDHNIKENIYELFPKIKCQKRECINKEDVEDLKRYFKCEMNKIDADRKHFAHSYEEPKTYSMNDVSNITELIGTLEGVLGSVYRKVIAIRSIEPDFSFNPIKNELQGKAKTIARDIVGICFFGSIKEFKHRIEENNYSERRDELYSKIKGRYKSWKQTTNEEEIKKKGINDSCFIAPVTNKE